MWLNGITENFDRCNDRVTLKANLKKKKLIFNDQQQKSRAQNCTHRAPKNGNLFLAFVFDVNWLLSSSVNSICLHFDARNSDSEWKSWY